MKKKFYVAWSEGLLENPEALNILKNSGLIEGIETRLNKGEDLTLLKDLGLKISLHRPPLGFDLHFGDKNFLDFFESEMGKEIIKIIDESESPTIGFHLSFKEEAFSTPKELFNLLLTNIVCFSRKINKRTVFEAVPGEGRFGKYSNIINNPSFISKILNNSKNEKISPGVLLDISHNYIIANNLKKEKLFNKGVSEYFDLLLENFSGRINQIHVNVPTEINGEYIDTHNFFKKENPLTKEILELTNKVIKKSQEIETITLEFYSDLNPVEYAKETIKQAEILNQCLL